MRARIIRSLKKKTLRKMKKDKKGKRWERMKHRQ
jgi:hypothetical protein